VILHIQMDIRIDKTVTDISQLDGQQALTSLGQPQHSVNPFTIPTPDSLQFPDLLHGHNEDPPSISIDVADSSLGVRGGGHENDQGGYSHVMDPFGEVINGSSLKSSSEHKRVSSDFSNEESNSSSNSSNSMWSLEYYQKYFNVNSKQIGLRLLRALIPLKPFYTYYDNKPDLYGPFWVATTLVILMAATGNMSSYLSSMNPTEWHYDFEKVTFAASVFYSTITFIPICIWYFLNRVMDSTSSTQSSTTGSEPSSSSNAAAESLSELVGMNGSNVSQSSSSRGLVEVISIYGYSLFVFVPSSVICMAPISWIQWLAISISFVWSTAFVVANLYPNWWGADHHRYRYDSIFTQQHKYLNILFAIIITIHLAISFLTKFYFFDYLKVQ